MYPRLWAALVAMAAFGCSSDSDNPLEPAENGPTQRRASAYPARIELGTLGGTHSLATDINNAGTVVGNANTSAGQFHAFRWTLAGGMVDLGTLPGDGMSQAADIDEQGNILGISCGPAACQDVTWDAAGVIHPLALPFTVPAPYEDVSVELPNEEGQWAGTLYDLNAEGSWVPGGDAAVFYSEPTGLVNLRTLGAASGNDPSVFGTYAYNSAVDINAHGTVVATGGYEDTWRAFLWSPEDGFRLPGTPPVPDGSWTRVVPLGLNNRDEVVGWYLSQWNDQNGEPVGWSGGAYRWSSKKGYSILDGGSGSYAAAVNDNGEAVGVVWPANAAAAAWPRTGGIKMLATTPEEPSLALAINNDGLAVGWEGPAEALAPQRALLWNTARYRVERGSKARGPHVASAFDAKIHDCLTRPHGKRARALCFGR